MQSLLNLHSSYGLPICVSGISHHPTLSKEMADHDRRREAIKRQRSQGEEQVHANSDMGTWGNHERVIGEIKEGEVDEDLAGVLNDLSCSYLACIAKAA
uniref:Uncharacterized protein n=1 Tax=Fagus sylvatica TaxID=28930 RepID=A0A2N9FRV5_FAGSY